ncbi:MAG TPA: AMP-binding protein, partial [Burkholderiales bacterium]|nr:AMP-binding protein [Burkholderiales bacterium]
MAANPEQLWQPSTSRIADANITAFIKLINKRWQAGVADSIALYEWSVAQPEQFWTAVWDFCGVIAERRGERVLVDGHKMPGARWFPDAKLNFAENLLRRRDDETAMVFWGENKVRRRMSFFELHDAVSRTAQALTAAGVNQGDRVAAFMPNLPESIIFMLAAASLGAIWSSCSPDFGVQGVLDRFGQIKPTILFAVEGYHYNGKVIDTL